jgi:hypothetical protein
MRRKLRTVDMLVACAVGCVSAVYIWTPLLEKKYGPVTRRATASLAADGSTTPPTLTSTSTPTPTPSAGADGGDRSGRS